MSVNRVDINDIEGLLNNYIDNVCERYKLDKQQIEEILQRENEENVNIYEVMQLIGKKRGALISGGNVDDEKTAKIIIDDFRKTSLSCKFINDITA